MARLFGTDGIRGVANSSITCELAYRLGQATVVFLGSHILVGRDTRVSGEMLENALAAGIMSMGGTVVRAGILPTPAIALMVREYECSGGVVISASHNPPEYNGLKVFDAFGYKLPDAREDEMEAFITSGEAVPDTPAAGDATGTSILAENACELYINHVIGAVREQGISFEGLRVALDCAYGASVKTSKQALKELGAEVHCINSEACGKKINVKCGSTCLDPLRKLVAETGAHVGIAHDGDADRVMLIDSQGSEIDGDAMGAMLAIGMKNRGVLAKDTFVGTVMCNLGFTHAMRDAGINVVQTKVGDRYVLEEMRAHGYNLGGEQSGHMIMLNHNTTGDGLMTAVQYIAAVIRGGKPYAQAFVEASHLFEKFPQVLINVSGVDKHALENNEAIWNVVRSVEEQLGDSGRVLLRPSGTEPLVRVMVEAATTEIANERAQEIANIVKSELAL